MKKRVVMTIAGLWRNLYLECCCISTNKTSVEERGPVQESTISIPDSEILAEEKEVAATIESTTTTSTIKTTSDSLEKPLRQLPQRLLRQNRGAQVSQALHNIGKK